MATETMSPNPASPRSRRAILAAAGGGLAALAAGALGGASPVRAANGDTVHVGDDLTGTTVTRITNSSDFDHAIWGRVTGIAGTGLAGESTSGVGVYGSSSNGYGVQGQTDSPSYPAVDGWNNVGNGTGVSGRSGAGTAGAPPVKTGVFGWAIQDATSKGVYGKSSAGQAVRGEATTTGIGVYGTAPLTGFALQAAGKVKFSRSGKASMAAGTSSKTVSLAGVTTGSLIFAVLGANRTGRYVRAVVAASGKFTIYLNTTVLSSTSVSWFVLN